MNLPVLQLEFEVGVCLLPSLASTFGRINFPAAFVYRN